MQYNAIHSGNWTDMVLWSVLLLALLGTSERMGHMPMRRGKDKREDDGRRIGNFWWDDPNEDKLNKPKGRANVLYSPGDKTGPPARRHTRNREGIPYEYTTEEAAREDAAAFHQGTKEAYIYGTPPGEREGKMYRVDNGRPPVTHDLTDI